MRITSISVYRVEIPFRPLGSLWIGRRAPDHLDSSIVAIETDAGLSGYGESCPIGAIYLPAFAKGLRAAIDAMAPALIGADPTRIDAIGKTMNEALFGHGYAKAALDIACWDLLGKATGLAVSELMGGRHQASVAAYASIPTDTPNAMVETFRAKRSEGFRRFQIKVGDDPLDDVARVRAIVRRRRCGCSFHGRCEPGVEQSRRFAGRGTASRCRLLRGATLRHLRGMPDCPRSVQTGR